MGRSPRAGRWWRSLALTVLWFAVAAASEIRVPTVPEVVIRQSADTGAAVRGRLVEGEPFEVIERVGGADCPVEGWGRLEGDGWACLDFTAPTDEAPAALPRLVAYDAPRPEDYDAYLDTQTWPAREPEALLPFVYARRWRGWEGQVWPGVEHWLHGDAPSGRLPAGRRARFVEAIDTEGGTVLVRPDGTVVPRDEVFVFPVTRFQGRDLEVEPLPDGATVAWVVAYDGAPVWPAPSTEGPPGATFAYHQQVVVRPGPDGWWEVPEGFLAASDVRAWVPADRPAQAGDDAVWVDVHLGQDTLALYEGDTARYVTLVSPGVGGQYATPTGTFAITDKSAWWDMASAPGAAEPYYVEAVPWVMHFKPRYALHGAYWHWGFGHRASHGCINLAPRDAAVVFDRLAPALPPGWHTVVATPSDPGSVLRVRP